MTNDDQNSKKPHNEYIPLTPEEQEARRVERKKAFMAARDEYEKNRKDYANMTAEEKILYNLEGIKKELDYKGIRSDCHSHKVFCIDCAIYEIQNNLKKKD